MLFAEPAGGTLYEDQVAELKLGKKASALYAEAKTLHRQLDRYAYGPPPVRLGEAERPLSTARGEQPSGFKTRPHEQRDPIIGPAVDRMTRAARLPATGGQPAPKHRAQRRKAQRGPSSHGSW